MRSSIQYQASNNGWVIYDNRGASGLVLILRTKEKALLHVLRLQEKTRVNGHHLYDDSQLIA